MSLFPSRLDPEAFALESALAGVGPSTVNVDQLTRLAVGLRANAPSVPPQGSLDRPLSELRQAVAAAAQAAEHVPMAIRRARAAVVSLAAAAGGSVLVASAATGTNPVSFVTRVVGEIPPLHVFVGNDAVDLGRHDDRIFRIEGTILSSDGKQATILSGRERLAIGIEFATVTMDTGELGQVRVGLTATFEGERTARGLEASVVRIHAATVAAPFAGVSPPSVASAGATPEAPSTEATPVTTPGSPIATPTVTAAPPRAAVTPIPAPTTIRGEPTVVAKATIEPGTESTATPRPAEATRPAEEAKTTPVPSRTPEPVVPSTVVSDATSTTGSTGEIPVRPQPRPDVGTADKPGIIGIAPK